MSSNNDSLSDLIKKVCPSLININLPNEQYKIKFRSLLNARITNDPRLKISALRLVLEMEYKHRTGQEIDKLKQEIENNKTFNKYMQAIYLDINNESRYGCHAKDREPDDKLVEALVQFFFNYLSVTYLDDPRLATIDRMNKRLYACASRFMSDKDYPPEHVSRLDDLARLAKLDINEVKKEFRDINSIDNACQLYLALNILIPYIDKLPKLKELMEAEVVDKNSFLNYIKGKSIGQLSIIKVY